MGSLCVSENKDDTLCVSKNGAWDFSSLRKWLRELNYLNPIEETKNMIDSQAIKNMCLHTSIDARIWRNDARINAG